MQPFQRSSSFSPVQPTVPSTDYPRVDKFPESKQVGYQGHVVSNQSRSTSLLVMRMKEIGFSVLSKLNFINKTTADYHKYRAKQIGTQINLMSRFMQKEFGSDIERSGLKSERTMTYEEFKLKKSIEDHSVSPLKGKVIELSTSKASELKQVEKIKHLNIPNIRLSKVIYSVKLLGFAASRLGWPIYHLYFKICEFPGRVGSVCMNVGNLREASSNEDLKAAHALLENLKNSTLIEQKDSSKLQGRNLQGVCFGTVLHLFSEYHNEENEKKFNNFEKLSNYSQGAPAEAVANQIVYEHISLSRKGKEAAGNEMQKNGVYLPPNGTIEQKQKVAAPFFLHEKEKILCATRGLNLEFCKEFPQLLSQKKDQDVYENLSKLGAGTYYVAISMGAGSHALAYVKHPDGTAHIFDPNKGAIRCYSNSEDHAKQLKRVIDCYQVSTEEGSQKNGVNHRIEIKKVTPLR